MRKSELRSFIWRAEADTSAFGCAWRRGNDRGACQLIYGRYEDTRKPTEEERGPRLPRQTDGLASSH
eukprot:2597349-Prymnesium_polylepis.1